MASSTESTSVITGQPNLAKQDLSKLDVNTLSATSPEVISRQATINIGTIGHVAHGKSTVVKAISGVQTVRFKNELERNITIKLDNLQFDANGTISWPSSFHGRKVDIQHALWATKYHKRNKGLVKKKPKLRLSNQTYAREYVVEKILAHEFEDGQQLFFVKWQGYPTSCNTWEPLEHLTNCPTALREFFAENLGKQVVDTLYEKFNIATNINNDTLLNMVQTIDLSNLPDKLVVQKELLRLLATTPKERHVKVLAKGKNNLLMYQLLLKREEQMLKLSAWEKLINECSEHHAVITVENVVDLECPPEGFHYVNKNVGKIKIPENPSEGCNCKECGPYIKTCCGRQSHNSFFTYTTRGKVNINPGIPIYECNKLCKCGPDCRNRVVQNGTKVPLCIFRTSNGCGWGVKSMRIIRCGEFVCEYVGEVITHEEAEIRGQAYDAAGRTYLFDLDYNSKDNPYTVDAARFGNVSHFINHSCDPNLGVYAVWINCSDPNLPRLALFALRDIKKDEELTFDYMMNPDTPEKRPKLRTPEKNEIVQSGRSICKCAADSCRRYLF